MSDRPVFIPSRKRTTKKKPFFHGAFTGGFSAGHFNTVGSEQGWTPQEDEVGVRLRSQRPEDFMDEQDHNEWGGPTSVRTEYEAAAATTAATASLPVARAAAAATAVTLDPVLDLVKPPAQNIGHRLLRVLGWRDGSTTAYVPHEEERSAAVLLDPTSENKSVESLLSSRKLRKIQLQQTRVKLPPPKLDTCGLGYERYQNAPEFRAHREKRRREAQERAKAVTSSSAANPNVYRLSNLLDKDEVDESQEPLRAHAQNEDDPLVSFETDESFVGTRTVGGFALREDDDDVYDDNVKSTKMDSEEYDNVVYEHMSDAEDDSPNGTATAATAEEFGSVFASFATSKTSNTQTSTTRGVTSDGRPPIQGFVLGSSSSSKVAKRYPGPDLPAGYQPKRHEFGKDDYPGAGQDGSHAAKQELMEQRRRKVQEERQANRTIEKEKERDSGPMAGAAFAGLAAAMKNRFTSSAAPESSHEAGPTAIGLQRPSSNATAPLDQAARKTDTPVAPKPITIQRSTKTFVPESLVCKRFHVVAPAHAKSTTVGTKTFEPSAESAYFEREIMSIASTSANRNSLSEEKRPDGGAVNKSLALQQQLLGESNHNEEDGENRPSMKVLESIFEPESESTESEEEEEDNDETAASADEAPQDQVSGLLSLQAPTPIPPGVPDGVLAPAPSSLIDERKDVQEGESRKPRRRKHRDGDDYDRKRRKRRSRSRSPSSSSDRPRRKRSRKREEKKKRKKRHKSSRRRDDSS